MRRWRFLGLGLLVLLVATVAMWVRTTPATRPPMEDPAANATHGDFRIRTDAGDLALSELRGQVVVVYFGYLACPDICPTTLATLGAAVNRLSPEDEARVTSVFVSVDPDRDTVERIGPYVRYFHPGFHGGTLPAAAVAEVAADWGVVYRKVADAGSAMAYSVDHSTDSYLVGVDGRYLGTIAHGTPASEVAARLEAQLRASPQPPVQGGSAP